MGGWMSFQGDFSRHEVAQRRWPLSPCPDERYSEEIPRQSLAAGSGNKQNYLFQKIFLIIVDQTFPTWIHCFSNTRSSTQIISHSISINFTIRSYKMLFGGVAFGLLTAPVLSCVWESNTIAYNVHTCCLIHARDYMLHCVRVVAMQAGACTFAWHDSMLPSRHPRSSLGPDTRQHTTLQNTIQKNTWHCTNKLWHEIRESLVSCFSCMRSCTCLWSYFLPL